MKIFRKLQDTYLLGEADALARQGDYKNLSGFCYSAKKKKSKNGLFLTPGRFVGFLR